MVLASLAALVRQLAALIDQAVPQVVGPVAHGRGQLLLDGGHVDVEDFAKRLMALYLVQVPSYAMVYGAFACAPVPWRSARIAS